MIPDGALPGFLATTAPVVEALPIATSPDCGDINFAHWGLNSLTTGHPVFALSQIRRTASGAISDDDLVDGLRRGPDQMMALLPPFGAVVAEDSRAVMVADSMGFRQLYHTDPGLPGAAGLSTSALILAQLGDAGLDETGLAVQSLLGWQLGQRTLFSGVSKLAPGVVATASRGGVELTEAQQLDYPEMELSDAVETAAALLRESLAALLDDHPDAVLQLTGGQDSRILLSAVPVARRRGLRAMTLGVPGSGDVEVAGRIASRYGLDHSVHGLTSLRSIAPSEAWELVRAASVRLDGMSDPVALAALAVGESSFEQGVRISGLGGEVGRGFYYLGKVRDRSYSRRDAEQLAAWRMFVNEAVEPGMLTPEFAEWARDAANSEVYSALLQGGTEWFRATDHLYLRHRMQRWAGVTDTAVAYQRLVINPMLDHQFLTVASRLAPSSKSRSLFLARLQMELDPELGRLPLEGRPAPVAYAHPSLKRTISGAYGNALRIARKLSQRLRHANRPPAGGDLLARKVVEHWRHEPHIVTNRVHPSFVREEWIDGLLAGSVDPRPSSVALMTNLIVASEVAPPRPRAQCAR